MCFWRSSQRFYSENRTIQDFYNSLIVLGYKQCDDHGTKFQKDTIIIDVCEFPDDADLSVEILVTPDFDVNMLAYDGQRIFNYQNPNHDISETVANIKVKRAKCILPYPERYEKMHNKGSTLLE